MTGFMPLSATLPLTGMRAFEAAARHGSFARAAEELGVSASAISQQIKRLERKIGKPLFHRLNWEVRLTDVGKVMAPKLDRLFSELCAVFTEALAGDVL